MSQVLPLPTNGWKIAPYSYINRKGQEHKPDWAYRFGASITQVVVPLELLNWLRITGSDTKLLPEQPQREALLRRHGLREVGNASRLVIGFDGFGSLGARKLTDMIRSVQRIPLYRPIQYTQTLSVSCV